MEKFARLLTAMMIYCLSSHAYAGWEYSRNVDRFTDADRSVITASADMYERQDTVLIIALGCMEDGLNLLLSHKYLGGDGDNEILVQMRIDKKEPYGPNYWRLFPGHEASWMPMADVPKMVRELRAGNQLHIRVVDPLDGETLNQSVSLQGFSGAIEKLSCYSR